MPFASQKVGSQDSIATPSASLQNDKNKIATPASGVARNDSNAECDSRKAQLEGLYNKKDKKKLIVVPRPNLDTIFALTAWQYIDKFEDFDSQRIEKFIDAHRDNGPEKTME